MRVAGEKGVNRRALEEQERKGAEKRGNPFQIGEGYSNLRVLS